MQHHSKAHSLPDTLCDHKTPWQSRESITTRWRSSGARPGATDWRKPIHHSLNSSKLAPETTDAPHGPRQATSIAHTDPPVHTPISSAATPSRISQHSGTNTRVLESESPALWATHELHGPSQWRQATGCTPSSNIVGCAMSPSLLRLLVTFPPPHVRLTHPLSWGGCRAWGVGRHGPHEADRAQVHRAEECAGEVGEQSRSPPGREDTQGRQEARRFQEARHSPRPQVRSPPHSLSIPHTRPVAKKHCWKLTTLSTTPPNSRHPNSNAVKAGPLSLDL